MRDRWNELNLRATAILWLRPRLKDVPVDQDRTILAAKKDGDCVALTLDNAVKRFDHVLLATGYRIDVDKMGLLAPKLREKIARHGGLPMLQLAGLNRACPACISSAPPRLPVSGRCCALSQARDLRRGASPAQRGAALGTPDQDPQHGLCRNRTRDRLPPSVNIHELHANAGGGEPGAPAA